MHCSARCCDFGRSAVRRELNHQDTKTTKRVSPDPHSIGASTQSNLDLNRNAWCPSCLGGSTACLQLFSKCPSIFRETSAIVLGKCSAAWIAAETCGRRGGMTE